jgi:peptidyl-prolyl cis-trans isomerase B (cyclophilin B)
LAFIEVAKTTNMNFVFLIISLVLISGFVGSVFAQQITVEKEYSLGEIAEMKNKAVLITTNEGSFFIELFPEDAPNTVHNFLELIESGYYDGIVFHRIIPNFMIQAGDPNTIGPNSDRDTWGQGGPGYTINEEFNTIQHDRGIVSMARSQHVHSAGSQFFIIHKDNNQLDGKYTVFGRLVPGTHSLAALDQIANLPTNKNNQPLDTSSATITKTAIIDGFTTSGFSGPDRNSSLLKNIKTEGGITDRYYNSLHDVIFDVPYRWIVAEGGGDNLNLTVEPTPLEHNVQKMIETTGYTPQVLVGSEPRNLNAESAGISTAFFSLKNGDDPKILANYIFENDAGRKAHLVISTQNMETSTETVQFKIAQIHFTNSDTAYSIIHINLTEWFRYEINSFDSVVKQFEIMIDGKMQNIEFGQHPVFRQLINDSREKPEPESLPPARVGGCLIATATFGSEMAPQVQFLREIRDNMVLQTESGTNFMTGFNQFYYSFSPAIADYERENPTFKEAVKITLTPLLTSLTLLQYVDIDSESEMLGYGIGIILLNIGMYFIAPAVLITKIRSFYKLQ